MPEGIPNKVEVSADQIDMLRNFRINEEVFGLNMETDKPEDGWEYAGFDTVTGLVNLVKVEDGSTRDLSVETFLERNPRY